MSTRFRFRNTGVCLSMALVIGASAAAPAHAAGPQPRPAGVTSPAQIDIPLSDARQIEANSIRFSATQFTQKAPCVVLLGATKQGWANVKAGLQEAAYEGYPTAIIFMGSQNEASSLEVYAKGHSVTNPINVNTISPEEVTRLLKDIWREYYSD